MKRPRLISSLLLSTVILGTMAPIVNANTVTPKNATTQPTVQSQTQVSKVTAATSVSWGGLTLTLDENGILTIPTGTASNLDGSGIAAAITAAGANPDSVTSINISGSLTLQGDGSKAFSDMKNMTAITGLNKINTTDIRNMKSMFESDKALASLNLSSFDTSNVGDMGMMFANSTSLISLDLSSFDTSNVINMGGMFFSSTGLTNLDVSSFNTSKVTDMGEMFMNNSLISLDLSNFNTSNVTDMNYMISDNPSLMNLDVSSFDTSKVVNMESMFFNDPRLTSLDLSSFNTSNVTKMATMFAASKNIKLLKLGSHFKSMVGTSLPDIAASNKYTGKWQNIGTGTPETPAGTNIWSSADFMTNFAPNFADTYVWQPVAGGDITVKYQDDKGNKIGNDVVLHGNVDDNYTTDKKAYAGYTFKEVQGNASGSFTTSAQTVTYIYTKNPTPVPGGDVTVKYVDGSGKSIASSIVLKGNVGDKYTSNKKAISGYTYQKTQGNPNGTFTIKAQTVSYVYTKNNVPNKGVSVYRAYNPNSGEHVYTTSKYEYDSIIKVGWKGEGVAWVAPSTGIPTYRAYNPNTGEHFYTNSLYEYNSVTSKGWRKEGIASYSGANKGIPIYRAFNPNATGPGSHFYTTSSFEYNSIASKGWRKEGTAFYALSK